MKVVLGIYQQNEIRRLHKMRFWEMLIYLYFNSNCELLFLT